MPHFGPSGAGLVLGNWQRHPQQLFSIVHFRQRLVNCNMPGCHVALASEEEQIQETQDGWAITLHVHHTAHQEGANSLCAAT